MSLDLDLKSDAELIAAVREGDTASYGVLYERHLIAAKRAASCLANSAAEREDLVADAFTRVLRALRDGNGPNEEFRAYLLVTMRNAAISTSRGASVSLYPDVPEIFMPTRTGGDPVVNKWDAMTAAAAFASLPERWRTVLWHTEVEEETPAEIAPLLGMRPNGVAALAYRAREGLRQAYLRAHLPDVESRECQATVAKLAGWVRRSVPVPLGRKISKHLAVCADCRARVDTLTRVNQELRASVAPILLGASFAAAYVPVAAASSGAAAGAVAAKTLLAKAAMVAVIAATAVTTMASAPHAGDDASPTAIPALAEPTEATDSIEGPNPADKHSSDVPGAPVTTTTTVPAAPVDQEAVAEDTAATDTTTATDTTAADEKAAAKAAKQEAKAEKQAAKAEKKAAKEAAKESKKAEKGK